MLRGLTWGESLRRRVLDPVGCGAILGTEWGFTASEAGLRFKGFQSIPSAENRLKGEQWWKPRGLGGLCR